MREMEGCFMSLWYERSVFYHIYPLGMLGAPFENTDDTISHRLRELNDWIPHLNSLGITAIYIGPIFESSTHGYDTIDFKKIDRRLGTEEDFISFVDQCHQFNIRVVVDGVFNHVGRGFFAFMNLLEKREQSPYFHWFRNVNFGGSTPYCDPFSYDAWQGHFELACLNLHNDDVVNHLLDAVGYWIDTYKIDGIRLDCANVLDFGFMEKLRRYTKEQKEDFWLMGEVIHGDYGRYMQDHILHSVTNYELHKSLYSGLNDHNFFEIAHNVKRLEAVGRKLYTFLDNHDENRIASKLNKKQHLLLAWALILTLPGIPSLYYGSEWGLEGMRTQDSDSALRPTLKLQDQEQKDSYLLDFLSKLIKYHSDCDAFHNGTYEELLLTNRQYAYARHGHTQTSITALNSDDNQSHVTIPIPSGFQTGIDILTGTHYTVEHQKLTLPLEGNHAIVLKLIKE